jgi:hypothetical protein
LAAAADWDALVAELLERHYDPAYMRSTVSHYRGLSGARRLPIVSSDRDGFERAAHALLDPVAEAVASVE